MKTVSEATVSVSKQFFLTLTASNVDVLKAIDKLIFKMFNVVVALSQLHQTF
jgi:hypothetical protein